jgi:hypothetical protein
MRQLSPGDIIRKLAQIEHSERSSRWKKRAKANMLRDQKAEPVPDTKHIDTPRGRICAKRRYTTYVAAFQSLTEIWAKGLTHRHENRVHHCPYCQGWHLTSESYEEDPDERAKAKGPRGHRR